jgi:hypothetical protein
MSTDVERYQDLNPELDEQQLLPDPEERGRFFTMDRFRRFIGGALLTSTVAYGATNVIEHPQATAISATRYVAETIYEDTPMGWAAQAFDEYMTHREGWNKPTYTEFKSFHSREHPTPPHPLVTNFIFTGLREMHGEEIASEIDNATNHQYPIRYQENGNQPISADYMAEQIIKSIKEHPLDTPYIGFTCHSMGGIMLIETLDRLQQMGYKLPKIAFIDFLSTPSGMQTARFGAAGNFLTKAQIGQSATGAVVSNFFSQMQAQNFSPKWWSHDFFKSFDELSTESSPALTRSQMEALDAVDSYQTLITKLKLLTSVISKDTKFRYFGPVDPNTDQVVDDIAAHQQLASAVYEVFGATMPYIPWGKGHAETDFPRNPQASTKLRVSELPSSALAGHPIHGINPGSLVGANSGNS